MSEQLLHSNVQEAVGALRHALRALVVGAGADPRQPQEVHRRFGIDRVLCWKISRIVKAEAAEDALRQLPTDDAFGIFLAGFERAGAASDDLSRVRAAVGAVGAALEAHVGDRQTLELILDSAARGRDGLMVSRKLAFRGNSGIWGVQASVRHQLVVLAPGTEADSVDSAIVATWVDFRRLRPDASWRVFQRQQLTQGLPNPPQPIDRGQEPGGPMLLPEFCSRLPQLLTRVEGDLTHYEIGPSAAGAAGAFTLVAGCVQRNHGSRRAAAPLGDVAEFAAHVLAPVEQLVVDLLVHESLGLLRDAKLRLCSAAFNDGSLRNALMVLPIEAAREDLGQPALLAHPDVPRLGPLVARVLERGGWQADEFAGLRFQVDYPPFPSVAVLSCPLEAAP